MGNFFDSGAADLGQSLSGAGAGGLAGFVQGMQLKQQMEKQALEHLQLQRALQNPHITALAHGAYLVQDPVTGAITHHLSPGSLPGGHQAFAINRFLGQPEDPVTRQLMDFIFKTDPNLIAAKTDTEISRGEKETEHAGVYRGQGAEIAPTAEAKRGLIEARTEQSIANADLAGARASTEGARKGFLERQAARVEALTQPEVNVKKELAKRNEQMAARYAQQIENDKELTPARKELLEARRDAALEAAKRHREAAKGGGGKAAPENSVTIGMDALGRPYVKPTFKKPEDAKAFLNTYQQWTQPLKNLDTGYFGNKKEALSKIRATWIEKNKPTEAEVAGFDQAMREAAQ